MSSMPLPPPAGIVGLVISYALTINGFLNSVVTSLTETEREFVSVERLQQYIGNAPCDGAGAGVLCFVLCYGVCYVV